jgi:metal-responsive CopG/Arc/MetJ family transcriptional regulator
MSEDPKPERRVRAIHFSADKELEEDIDRAAEEAGESRSEWIRNALKDKLQRGF